MAIEDLPKKKKKEFSTFYYLIQPKNIFGYRYIDSQKKAGSSKTKQSKAKQS